MAQKKTATQTETQPKIKFRLTPIHALLMHNPAGMRSPDGTMGRRKIPTPEQEAEASCYRLPSGQLYMKSDAIRAAVIKATQGRKIGKFSAKKIFGACLFSAQEVCPLFTKNGEPLTTYSVDVQRAVVQGQGVMRARAKISDYVMEVEFYYDPEFLNRSNIEEAIQLAGKIIGIGDYRPDCPKGVGGPYGRFRAELVS
jgi:hypothetical protein